MMMDQAGALSRRKFPTAMVLPATAISSPEGVRVAILRFVEKAGIPAVLYIKDAHYVTIDTVKALVAHGAISWIKYAVVRPDPAVDPLLRALVDAVDPALIVSGVGEQPAIAHWRVLDCVRSLPVASAWRHPAVARNVTRIASGRF